MSTWAQGSQSPYGNEFNMFCILSEKESRVFEKEVQMGLWD